MSFAERAPLRTDTRTPADFFVEIAGSCKFFLDRWRNRKGTARPRTTVTDNQGKVKTRANFEEAFGFAGYDTAEVDAETEAGRMRMLGSYDENIRLAPYTYGGTGRRRATSTDEVTTASDSLEHGRHPSPAPTLGPSPDLRKMQTPV